MCNVYYDSPDSSAYRVTKDCLYSRHRIRRGLYLKTWFFCELKLKNNYESSRTVLLVLSKWWCQDQRNGGAKTNVMVVPRPT